MEVQKFILARAVQMLSVKATPAYLPDVIRAIVEKYGFAGCPKNEDIVPSDPPKGLEFTHGQLIGEGHRALVIDKFTIFNDGLIVDAALSTDDADLFLRDISTWVGVRMPLVKFSGPSLYVSQLEVKANFSEESVMPPIFRNVGTKIATLLDGYGVKVTEYQTSSVAMNYDMSRMPTAQAGQAQPGLLQIERRAGFPYDAGIWFTQAPLKTTDHIQLLEHLERGAI
jgi:hypothetical protein